MKDHAESGKKSENVILGKGHLDTVGLFKALRQIKFPADGALSLEYEANPMNPIDDMKACLEKLCRTRSSCVVTYLLYYRSSSPTVLPDAVSFG
jgi:sugar phosphate isomerase/epimerase